jgi:hypothetical protein
MMNLSPLRTRLWQSPSVPVGVRWFDVTETRYGMAIEVCVLIVSERRRGV